MADNKILLMIKFILGATNFLILMVTTFTNIGKKDARLFAFYVPAIVVLLYATLFSLVAKAIPKPAIRIPITVATTVFLKGLQFVFVAPEVKDLNLAPNLALGLGIALAVLLVTLCIGGITMKKLSGALMVIPLINLIIVIIIPLVYCIYLLASTELLDHFLEKPLLIVAEVITDFGVLSNLFWGFVGNK